MGLGLGLGSGLGLGFGVTECQWYLDVNRNHCIPALLPSLELSPPPHPPALRLSTAQSPDWVFWCGDMLDLWCWDSFGRWCQWDPAIIIPLVVWGVSASPRPLTGVPDDAALLALFEYLLVWSMLTCTRPSGSLFGEDLPDLLKGFLLNL